MKKKNKIAIFGPYPPPLGGISVHIQRMQNFLKEAKIEHTIFNHSMHEELDVISTKKNPFWYLRFLLMKEYSLFHFHQFFNFHFWYYYLFLKLNKTPFIISIHSERLLDDTRKLNKVNFWFLKRLKNVNVISVSKSLHERLLTLNLKSTYLPAYVKPTAIKRKNIEKDGRILFLFSTWKIDKKLSEDIYNVPLIFRFLKNNKQKFKMLFMIGNKDGSDLKYLNKLIDEFKLLDDVYLLFNESLIDYIHNCEFLVRTNKSDGYGVSLQESMDLGVPAIASNVCQRPKGTVLFEDNDIDDLSNSIFKTINTNRDILLSKKEELNYHLELIELYNSFL